MTRSRHEAIRRRHVTRLLALWLAITLVPTALAAPSDITETSAPELGQSAPAAQTISAGDFSVATQTGAATYTFPLRSPPARSVGARYSLTYSSQAAIYGGVASGWSLEIPSVMYDTSRARFRSVHYAGTAEPEWDDEPYISTLSGGRPLVKVTGDVAATNAFAQYRARNDSGWILYSRFRASEYPTSARWTARTPDGTTYFFGEPGQITNLMSGTVSTTALTRVRAPLTREVDQFGNESRYYWTLEADELRITQIRYTFNAASGVDYFAEVNFTWQPMPTCQGIAVGSQSDFRTGLKLVDGKSRLTRISAVAVDPGTKAVEHTRQYDFGYFDAVSHIVNPSVENTELCGTTATHAPFRQLRAIQESAWHAGKPAVVLPAVSFDYGSATLAYPDAAQITQHPWNNPSQPLNDNLAWGFRFSDGGWPSVEATMVDLDGDGLVDRLVNASTDLADAGLQGRLVSEPRQRIVRASAERDRPSPAALGNRLRTRRPAVRGELPARRDQQPHRLGRVRDATREGLVPGLQICRRDGRWQARAGYRDPARRTLRSIGPIDSDASRRSMADLPRRPIRLSAPRLRLHDVSARVLRRAAVSDEAEPRRGVRG